MYDTGIQVRKTKWDSKDLELLVFSSVLRTLSETLGPMRDRNAPEIWDLCHRNEADGNVEAPHCIWPGEVVKVHFQRLTTSGLLRLPRSVLWPVIPASKLAAT